MCVRSISAFQVAKRHVVGPNAQKTYSDKLRKRTPVPSIRQQNVPCDWRKVRLPFETQLHRNILAHTESQTKKSLCERPLFGPKSCGQEARRVCECACISSVLHNGGRRSKKVRQADNVALPSQTTHRNSKRHCRRSCCCDGERSHWHRFLSAQTLSHARSNSKVI